MNLSNTFTLNIVKLNTKYDYIFSLELLWVFTWLKKIAKLEPFTLKNIQQIKPCLEKYNISYVYYEKKEYFDHEKMLFVSDKQGADTYVDMYISKSENVLSSLESMISWGNDFKTKNYFIWKLLGYPDCCIRAFLANNYSSDFNYNMLIKSKTVWRFDWRLNNLINPYSLIPFFPCSYNCVAAIEYAQNNIKLLWNEKEIKKVFKNIIYYRSFWDISFVSSIDYKNSQDLQASQNIFNFSHIT